MTTPILSLTELPNSVFDPSEIVNGLLSGLESAANNQLLGHYALDNYMDALGAVVDYKLDEASGNLIDRVGAQDLTANGTVTYQQDSGWTGAGDGIDFDGSTGYFTASNASIFDSLDSGSIVLCFEVDTLPGSGSICLTSYADAASTNYYFSIEVESDGTIFAFMRTTSSSAQWKFESVASQISASTVYSFILNHNGTLPTAFINGVSMTFTEAEATLTVENWLDDLTDADNLCVGALDQSSTVNHFDGKIYRVVYATTDNIDATVAQNIHNALEFGYSEATS